MATKLSDSELAARVRAGNRQRAARQHERRRESGKVAVSVWLNTSTKAALANTAAANNTTISATVEKLLELGLKQTATSTKAVDTSPPDKDALMKQVGAMLEEGLNGSDIARRLNDTGHRTAGGAEFIGGNLLRDYRTWCKKPSQTDSA